MHKPTIQSRSDNAWLLCGIVLAFEMCRALCTLPCTVGSLFIASYSWLSDHHIQWQCCQSSVTCVGTVTVHLHMYRQCSEVNWPSIRKGRHVTWACGAWEVSRALISMGCRLAARNSSHLWVSLHWLWACNSDEKHVSLLSYPFCLIRST